MGLFDINDEKLQEFYNMALFEANYGFVNPRKFPYLNCAIMQYARENNCSYLVDKETGVNYLCLKSVYGASITPLLDSEGKVIVTK